MCLELLYFYHNNINLISFKKANYSLYSLDLNIN